MDLGGVDGRRVTLTDEPKFQGFLDGFRIVSAQTTFAWWSDIRYIIC